MVISIESPFYSPAQTRTKNSTCRIFLFCLGFVLFFQCFLRALLVPSALPKQPCSYAFPGMSSTKMKLTRSSELRSAGTCQSGEQVNWGHLSQRELPGPSPTSCRTSAIRTHALVSRTPATTLHSSPSLAAGRCPRLHENPTVAGNPRVHSIELFPGFIKGNGWRLMR